MIIEKDRIFILSTKETGCVLAITRHGHLEQVHYGARVGDENPEPLRHKQTAVLGSQVLYDNDDKTYCLDAIPLAWSGIGKGDYRQSPCEIQMPDLSYVSDFVYESHRILKGTIPMKSLPSAYANEEDCESLEIRLRDEANGLTLLLIHTVFPDADVITRRTVLRNSSDRPAVIRKLMSLSIDLPYQGDRVVSFHGGWIREAHPQDVPLPFGLFVREGTTGASGNRHNPGFLIAEQGAGETFGNVYGFNLIYSGNHYSGVERSEGGLFRVMTGISPSCFSWPLAPGEEFETPEAVMTFSASGINGVSGHFHDFVNEHIVRGDWKGKERPVILNNWEADFFVFTEKSLLRLAKRAKKTGAELFVLDDGWFGERNSDEKGLGDYSVNRKKLPGGLHRLSERIERMGMKFGLWFEPEMVNPDSDLFRAHPEYAVSVPGRQPAFGRNQLVLDLCNKEVRDYIVRSVRGILDGAHISYVKWDMNRHISDMYSPVLPDQGMFSHRYILGLYEVLGRIFGDRPDILVETCSSGGNRFDLGMLCYSQQIWTSDDTDPIERLSIQGGISHLYPLSTISAHVSGAPHQQTLRATPLSTRFHTAAFGCLGYELDLKYLSRPERREVQEQIAYYKAHRATFQYGRFYRLPAIKSNKVHWEVLSKDGSEGIAGFFQTQAEAAEAGDILPLRGLDPDQKYTIRTRPQPIYVKRFGVLINFLLPFPIHPEGFTARLINRFYRLTDCVEEYTGSGRMLEAGVRLNTPFSGTFYNPHVRLLSDFGSNLYTITRIP